MAHRVYVETTIPSFYFEVRQEAAMVARRDWTRRWWEVATTQDDLVTSVPVLDELAQGDFPSREECLGLLDGLPLLAVDQTVMEIVETYIRHQVMPKDPVGDAMHLALASLLLRCKPRGPAGGRSLHVPWREPKLARRVAAGL